MKESVFITLFIGIIMAAFASSGHHHLYKKAGILIIIWQEQQCNVPIT
jgi:hypothetical protein